MQKKLCDQYIGKASVSLYFQLSLKINICQENIFIILYKFLLFVCLIVFDFHFKKA